jgi:hypothetical protein
MPFRLSLILTAAEEIPSVWAISKTVIPSIYKSISVNNPINQEKIIEMLQHHHVLLYTWIVNFHKFHKFYEFFSLRTLTIHSSGYILFICYNIVTYNKRSPEEPVTGSP